MDTNQTLDLLCQDVPDTSPFDQTGMASVDDTGQFVVPQHLATPRTQLRRILDNMVLAEEPGWNGRLALAALRDIMDGKSRAAVLEACKVQGISMAQVWSFALLARTFPSLICNEIAGIQPLTHVDDKVFFQDVVGVDGRPGLRQVRLASCSVYAGCNRLYCSWQDTLSESNLDALLEALNGIGREISLECNHNLMLDLLLAAKEHRSVGEGGFDNLSALYNRIFSDRAGDVTHLFLGTEAAVEWQQRWNPGSRPTVYPNKYPGVSLLAEVWGELMAKVYSVPFWTKTHPRAILAVRRGLNWADVPSVWAPHRLTVTEEAAPGGPSTWTTRSQFNLHAAHRICNHDMLATMTLK
jgi:hypothetical protein